MVRNPSAALSVSPVLDSAETQFELRARVIHVRGVLEGFQHFSSGQIDLQSLAFQRHVERRLAAGARLLKHTGNGSAEPSVAHGELLADTAFHRGYHSQDAEPRAESFGLLQEAATAYLNAINEAALEPSDPESLAWVRQLGRVFSDAANNWQAVTPQLPPPALVHNRPEGATGEPQPSPEYHARLGRLLTSESRQLETLISRTETIFAPEKPTLTLV